MADPFDLLTLEEAKAAINQTAATSHVDELELWVTAVSHRIDDLCGPVVKRTVTDEQHPGGGTMLIPRQYPIMSVTSIKEFSGSGSVTLTAEDIGAGAVGGTTYWLDPALHVIYRRAAGYPMRFAPTRVLITYVAGRYADTAAVDPKFKMAVGAILRRLWAREAGAWARGGDPFTQEGTGAAGFFRAVDPMVAEFLGYEQRHPASA